MALLWWFLSACVVLLLTGCHVAAFSEPPMKHLADICGGTKTRTRSFASDASSRQEGHQTQKSAAIGLEVHAQLDTSAKLFCGCKVPTLLDPPNTCICPICTGQPGAYPKPNKSAILLAVRACIALGCCDILGERDGKQITSDRPQRSLRFVRKHYHYPDSPKGYQITQATSDAIGKWGSISMKGLTSRALEISHVLLEEDTARTHHRVNCTSQQAMTSIDYNRAGLGLIEIVTAPTLRTPTEASDAARLIAELLRNAGICRGTMESGALRFDVNVSLGDVTNKDKRSNRVELKNMISFDAIARAVAHEIVRQERVGDSKGSGVGESRWYSAQSRQPPRHLRPKMTAQEYRFLPEVTIPAYNITPSAFTAQHHRLILSSIRANNASNMQFARPNGVPKQISRALIRRPDILAFLQRTIEHFNSPPELTLKSGARILLGLGAKAIHPKTLGSDSTCQSMARLMRDANSGHLSSIGMKERILKLFASEPSGPLAPDSEIISDKSSLPAERLASIVATIAEDHMETVRAIHRHPSSQRRTLKQFHWLVGKCIEHVRGLQPGALNQADTSPPSVASALLHHLQTPLSSQ